MPTTQLNTAAPTILPTHSATNITDDDATPNSLDDDVGPRPDPTPSWCSTNWYICYLLPIIVTGVTVGVGYQYSQKRQDEAEEKNCGTFACQGIAAGLAAIGGYLSRSSNTEDPNNSTTPLLTQTKTVQQ